MKIILPVTILLVIPLTTTGCFGYVKPTEPDRQLNHQNIGAAKLVIALMSSAMSSDPGAVTAAFASALAAASDIKANSETLEKSLELKPEKPLPYSAQTSSEKRKESEESHAISPFWAALGGVGIAVLGWFGRGGFLRLLSVVAPTVAAGPLGTVSSVLIEGIARARLKAQASESKSISDQDLTELLGGLQKDAGVQGLVDKLRAKIEPKVKGLL